VSVNGFPDKFYLTYFNKVFEVFFILPPPVYHCGNLGGRKQKTTYSYSVKPVNNKSFVKFLLPFQAFL